MNSGRGWRGGGRPVQAPWQRPSGFRPPPPPLFRAGFAPRPPAFFPGPPPPWRRGGPGGPRGFGRGGFAPRGRGFGPRGGGVRKPHWKNRIIKNTPGRRLTEEETGVTQYVSEHEGFNGIIKSRYADFQVSEINEIGEVAKLTSLTLPEPPKKEEIVEDDELLLTKYNLELLPIDTWDKINALAVNTEPTTERVEVDVTGMSKEERTKIHDAVKKAFGDAIIGSTVTTNDKKLVRFEKYRKGVRIDNRVKWVWGGEYVRFIVHKENCDTMEAAVKIAERVNMKPSMLGYAGTKDRRAKSSQWFSLRRTEPRRIAQACRNLRELSVGNFTFSSKHLKLGMLRGNRFRIALRNVTAEEETVNLACEHLKQSGFINYYGLQRFGTRVDTPTYVIGLKLLQGNFKEAISEILEPRAGPLQQALQTYRDTGDAAAACIHLTHYSCNTIEGRLLRALAKEPNNLVGALGMLARNTRLLYAHSYQSLIWNRCVSHRLKTLGLKPAVGDLVLQHPDTLDSTDQGQDEESEDEESTNVNEKPAVVEAVPSETETLETKPNEVPASNGNTQGFVREKIPVHVLTEEDVASGKYSITDIVLPLPGYNVDYPPNMRDYYEELLTKDNVTMDLKHKIKSYSMCGAYRHLVVCPYELEWSLVRYSDAFGDLILSDLDELNGKQLTSIIPDGKYKALLLTMSLPASSYATMALRELLRVDTSGDSQAQQNNYHKEGTDADTSVDSQSNADTIVDSQSNADTTVDSQSNADTTVDSQSNADTSVDNQTKAQANGENGNSEAEKRKLSAESEGEGDAKKQKIDV